MKRLLHAFPRIHPRLFSYVVLVVLIFTFSWVSIASFQQKSATVDEPVHLLAGYSYLKWRDFRANPEHPPLAKALAAFPLLFREIKDPRPSTPEWDLIPTKGPTELRTVSVAAQMLFVDNDAEKLFFSAKLMMIALAIFLGLFVYRWSTELFGPVGGAASLFVYLLDPNILAHGHLVHTDLPFSAFFFIGTYFFCRTLSGLSVADLIFACVFFGLAAITKFAYPAMFIVWAILGLVKICSSQPWPIAIGKLGRIDGRWGKIKILFCIFICVFVATYFFIWAAYGFSFHAVPGGKIRLPIEQELQRISHLQMLASLFIEYHLFPEAWLYGQLYVLNHLNRTSFLLGQILTSGGSWLYFPVAFAVKTPMPTLLLLLGVPVYSVLNRNARPIFFMLIPVVVYFFLAVWSGVNIGLRHILPIYPFLFVLCGAVAAWLWNSRGRIQRMGLAVLGAWCVFSSLSVFPDYLAFFNELGGGAGKGHKILLESNLDWGQDLKGLKRWMENNSLKKIQFLYFGFHDARAPRYYGIDAMYLPGSWVSDSDIASQKPPFPSFLAVSANHLYEYLLQRGERELVKTLQQIDPVASIGYSIRVYNVEAAIQEFRRMVQTNPKSSENHYHLANLLRHQGMTANAVEEYREALWLHPTYAEAHHFLGLILARAGALEEAVRHFQKALEGGPVQLRSESQYYLGTILAAQGRLAEAADGLKEVIRTEPNFPRAYYRLGVIYLALRDIERSTAYLREAILRDPQYVDAHLGLGRILAAQGKADEARTHYEEALQILKTQRIHEGRDFFGEK